MKMTKIQIYKGKEFKVCVEECIEEDSLFFEEYKKAAHMLDEIVRYDKTKADMRIDGQDMEYENNIIAICGERGEGKSSVMMTFVKAAVQYAFDGKSSERVFAEARHIKGKYFAEPVIIDPSLFDDRHSILDVVLAKLYSRVDARTGDSYFGGASDNDYKELIGCFQIVYKYVSLINNRRKSLDDQTDYEGDIGRLARLGDSTNLKRELIKLIRQYLKFISNEKKGEDESELIIAIDDLDLCSDKVYRMAEEIRKYLIIPNVVIVMALKVEQMEDCIREKYIHDYRGSFERYNFNNRITDEINIMTEKHVNKLIPKARRIYLPKVMDMYRLTIAYVDDWGEEKKEIWSTDEQDDIVAVMRKLIYQKTGIILLPKEAGKDILFSNNLRETVNMIVFLLGMNDPGAGNEKRYKNVAELEQYFEREWEHNNILMRDREEFYSLKRLGVDDVNDNACSFLQELFNDTRTRRDPSVENYSTEMGNDFTRVVYWLQTIDDCISNVYQKARAYSISVLYTFMLHKLMLDKKERELTKLLGGYVWSGMFANIIPGVGQTGIDRTRFTVKTEDAYNKILDCVGGDENEFVQFSRGKKGSVSVPKISTGKDKQDQLFAWILMALVANNYSYKSNSNNSSSNNKNDNQYTFVTNGTIVWNNSATHEFMHVSLENYILALFNIDSVCEKVSFRALGVEAEIKEYLNQIRERNRESIDFMRAVVSNMDIVVSILKYCKDNSDVKSGSENATRSNKLIKKFFENMVKYMEQYDVEGNVETLTHFVLTDEKSIDICDLYEKLIDIAETDHGVHDENEREGEQLMAEFKEKLRITPLPESWEQKKQKVSLYLQKVSTIATVKANLENLAVNIQRYIGENKILPYGFNADALCDFYAKVLDTYLQNENEPLTDELREEYKQMVAIHKTI